MAEEKEFDKREAARRTEEIMHEVENVRQLLRKEITDYYKYHLPASEADVARMEKALDRYLRDAANDIEMIRRTLH